tara:strand:- start:58 stop:270 length:213 start_codon:yes stop_codon:yes gene_type:complete
MKFTTIAKSNGATLFKEVDPSNKKFIKILKENGWVEVEEGKAKPKAASKKSKSKAKTRKWKDGKEVTSSK